MSIHAVPGFRQFFRNAEAGGAAGAGGGGGEGGGAAGAAAGAVGAVGSGAPAPAAGGAPAGAGTPDPAAAGAAQQTPEQITASFHAGLLPGAARDLIVSKGFGSANEVVNAYFQANRVLGGATDVLTIPQDGSTPEQVAAFRSKLGVPDTAAGYEFDLSQVKHVSEPMVEFSRKMFHEIGVPANQAQKALQMWENFIGEQNATLNSASEALNQAQVDAVKASLGSGADDFFANAKRAVIAMGLSNDALAKLEAAAGAGAVVELMGKIGKGLKEGAFTPGVGGGADDALTSPEAAQTEINKLQGNKEFLDKYTNKQHPEHTEALKRMEALFAATTQVKKAS